MRVELLLREIQGVVYQGATPSTRTTSGLDTRALPACLPASQPSPSLERGIGSLNTTAFTTSTHHLTRPPRPVAPKLS